MSEPKSYISLPFVRGASWRKGQTPTEEQMYDYFVEPVHIEWSEREGKDFIEDYLKPTGIKVSGADLLDISGGNGHFIKQIAALGARVTLTEINKKTIDYVRKVHGFHAVECDLNIHDLPTVTQQTYDVVFARACIMFARDLGKFVDEVRRSLRQGGIVLINHSVMPTLGVMLRTQLDEHSYFVLRQPETIESAFNNAGFELLHRADETDDSLYVYDNDYLRSWRLLHRFYERRCVARMAQDRRYAWPARDRRRSTLAFRLVQ